MTLRAVQSTPHYTLYYTIYIDITRTKDRLQRTDVQSHMSLLDLAVAVGRGSSDLVTDGWVGDFVTAPE